MLRLTCLLVFAAVGYSLDGAPSLQPPRLRCPPGPPRCANPTTNPLTGCPSCEHSNCKFRGCVRYGAFGPSWRPDDCTTCFCDHTHQERCSVSSCAQPNCGGYPVVHKPGQCCPECDFNINRDACGVVPAGVKTMSLALGGKCREEVQLHACDKTDPFFVEEDGQWYECRPTRSLVQMKLSQTCLRETSVSHMTYADVTACQRRRVAPSQLPQDFDPEPRSCAFYVEPREEPESPDRPDESGDGPELPGLPELPPLNLQ